MLVCRTRTTKAPLPWALRSPACQIRVINACCVGNSAASPLTQRAHDIRLSLSAYERDAHGVDPSLNAYERDAQDIIRPSLCAYERADW